MRAYETIIEEVTTAEIDTWPIGEAFPIHPRMQAVTLEVIIRAVFGVSDPGRIGRLRGLLSGLLSETTRRPADSRAARAALRPRRPAGRA